MRRPRRIVALTRAPRAQTCTSTWLALPFGWQSYLGDWMDAVDVAIGSVPWR